MVKHTPYDGSHPLFKIGLEPLELKDWIEVDDQLDFYLAEKARLKAAYGDNVFVEEADTRAAQREVLDLLLDHLEANHRESHQREGDCMKIGGRRVALSAGMPPLEIAAQLVQEDLIIMRRGEDGWRLVAASLSFPSSWHLREKFSRPLQDIHETVPGFGPGTRNAAMIERIFDNIKIDLPMRRFNWSVYSDNELFHDNRTAEHLSRGDLDAGAYLRVEHQTLRRLPVCGDILFTVRIHLDPLETLRDHPRREEICSGFVASLAVLNGDQLAYKGLTGTRDKLIKTLEKMAAKGVTE